MISFRENLRKIDITLQAPFSYKNSFTSKPKSLRQAIRSMDAPQSWQQVADISLDEYWTDEVQGVAWDGAHWIFSCNAYQLKPGSRNKSLYVFSDRGRLEDGEWISFYEFINVPHPISDTTENDDHWGQLVAYNGFVYISHFWEAGPKQGKKSVVIFKNNNGNLVFYRWIELSKVVDSNGISGYPEFQSINPWDGNFYSILPTSNSVTEFFIHNPDNGQWEGKTLPLRGYFPEKVQGACFSPNGHLYVSDDTRYTDWGKQYKWIFYYSALNGKYLGKIPVLAEEKYQELQGICYSERVFENEIRKEIMVVLLENVGTDPKFDKIGVGNDNLFFKSFKADFPDLI